MSSTSRLISVCVMVKAKFKHLAIERFEGKKYVLWPTFGDFTTFSIMLTVKEKDDLVAENPEWLISVAEDSPVYTPPQAVKKAERDARDKAKKVRKRSRPNSKKVKSKISK